MRTLQALLLAFALLLAGCAANDDASPEEDGTGDDAATNESNDAGMMMAEDVQVVVGEAPSTVPPSTTLYTLSPKTLELTVGKTYNLTLKNNGRLSHDLVIEGLDVTIPSTPAGATSEGVTFTPTVAGTFPMYCTLGASPATHKENGMSGEVVVS